MIDMVSTLKLDLYPRELVEGEIGRAVEIEVFRVSNIRLPAARIWFCRSSNGFDWAVTRAVVM